MGAAKKRKKRRAEEAQVPTLPLIHHGTLKKKLLVYVDLFYLLKKNLRIPAT